MKIQLSTLCALIFLMFGCGTDESGNLSGDWAGAAFYEENGNLYSSRLDLSFNTRSEVHGSIESGSNECRFEGTYSIPGDNMVNIGLDKERGAVCGWKANLTGTMDKEQTRFEGTYVSYGNLEFEGRFLLIRKEDDDETR